MTSSAISQEAASALRCETEFLSAVEGNFEAAKGKHFRGSTWTTQTSDELDRLKALLAQNGLHDRELLRSLPSNRRITLQGYERRLLFGRKRTGVAIASVLSPLGHFAAKGGGSAPPVSLGELTDHVRRLVADRKVPYIIGICSPTGFSEEARNVRMDLPNVSIVLVEPDRSGGWRTRAAGDSVDPRLPRIFDPESAKQKVERVTRLVEEHSAELLTGGLSVSSAARDANLPEETVRRGFEEIARRNAELKLTRKDGEWLLFRGAPTHGLEKKRMNVIDRIRKLFSGEGDEAAKINLLAERRAALAQRRDRIYDDIVKLEGKEAELLNAGKAATSMVPKRRLAAQLAQLRKDIARENTKASMLNQQINIISTDIHNLTLIQQGQVAKLPDTTELTEHAVAAEEMLETLKADAELVGSLEMGMDAALASSEELEILKEFEEEKPAAKTVETAPRVASPPMADRSRTERPAAKSPEPPSKLPPLPPSREPTGPEAV